MVSVSVEDALVEKIDSLIKASGLYSSRSDFLKDSIRVNLARASSIDSNLASFREKAKKWRSEVRAKVGEPRFPTREERAKIAREHFAKKGIKVEEN